MIAAAVLNALVVLPALLLILAALFGPWWVNERRADELRRLIELSEERAALGRACGVTNDNGGATECR